MTPQFIFGGNTGVATAADLERQRMLVEALMGRQAAPKNLGEGLSALGEAIGYRMAKSRLAKDEGAAKGAGDTLFKSLFGGEKDIADPAQPASYNTDPVEPPTPEPSFAESFLPKIQPEAPPETQVASLAPEGGGLDPLQAQPIPEPMPAAAPQQVAQADAVPGTPEFADLIQKYEMVLGDPNFQHVDPARQKIAQRRYEQLLEMQQQAVDPLRKMQLEKGQIEIENLRNPKLTPAEEAKMAFEREKFEYEKAKGDPAWEKLSDNSLFNKNTGEVKPVPGGPPAVDLKDVTSIRKEIQDTQQIKNYNQAAPIYRSMVETAGRNSRASDLNLVYGLGKIMDPTSVVREGEMVMVKDTASLPDWLQGSINRLNGGAGLLPETRVKIMDEAKSRMSAYGLEAENLRKQYEGLSQRHGINMDDIWQPLDKLPDYVPTIEDVGGVPEGWDPEDWKFLTPEEQKKARGR